MGDRTGDRPQVGTQDSIVLLVARDTKCKRCGTKIEKEGFLQKTRKRRLCLACAGLSHLVFLPRGDTALTRRAVKYSTLHAIVIRKTRPKSRKERHGVLVEAAARERADRECLADAAERESARARAAVRRAEADALYLVRFVERVGVLFPGCPVEERHAIAARACEKHSGRIGRTAAARRLDPVAITTAVRAHIRHRHTRYDQLWKSGRTRDKARNAVRKAVDRITMQWRKQERGDPSDGQSGA